MEYGVIHEVGNLGLGFDKLNENDQKVLNESDKQEENEEEK